MNNYCEFINCEVLGATLKRQVLEKYKSTYNIEEELIEDFNLIISHDMCDFHFDDFNEKSGVLLKSGLNLKIPFYFLHEMILSTIPDNLNLDGFNLLGYLFEPLDNINIDIHNDEYYDITHYKINLVIYRPLKKDLSIEDVSHIIFDAVSYIEEGHYTLWTCFDLRNILYKDSFLYSLIHRLFKESLPLLKDLLSKLMEKNKSLRSAAVIMDEFIKYFESDSNLKNISEYSNTYNEFKEFLKINPLYSLG